MNRERRIRVAAWQAEPGSRFPARSLDLLRDAAPEVIVLPEYFWVRPADRDARSAAQHYEEDRRQLGDLSREIDAIWVGGTVVEPAEDGRLHNVCLVYDRGREVLVYRKRRLMPGEAAGGIHPGETPAAGEVRGIRIGLLICADVFQAESWRELAGSGPDIIAIPTNSPFRPDDPVEEKYQRDLAYFVTGARRTGAYVVKACTVGRVFGRPVQGRSLIAGPEGVIARVPPEKEGEPQLLTAEITLA